MTTTVTITLAIIAVASIMTNALQWLEHKYERKEIKRLTQDNAALEFRLDDVSDKLSNEVLHREWAVGRIKDQTSLVKGLEHALKAASAEKYREYKQRKEAGNAQQ